MAFTRWPFQEASLLNISKFKAREDEICCSEDISSPNLGKNGPSSLMFICLFNLLPILDKALLAIWKPNVPNKFALFLWTVACGGF